MSAKRKRKAARSSSGPEPPALPPPALPKPVLCSPYAISRWDIDRPVPAELSREVAAGFCGALLRRLKDAVDEVIVEDRLGVLALPELPVPASEGRVAGVGLLVPRQRKESSTKALRAALGEVGAEGFSAAGRKLRLRRARAKPHEARRWVGPSRVWTSVTPWVSEADHAGRSVEQRTRCLHESIGMALFAELGPAEQAAEVARLVERAQTHDEAWVSGILPASETPEFRPGPPAHVRITFSGAVEGPIALGADRLFGMGLLVPMDMPSEPFDE